MTLEEITAAIRQLDDAQFQQLKSWVVTVEENRRAAQPEIEQAQADIVTELQDAGKLEKPEAATEEQAKEDAAQVPEWKNPGTDHALMYHYGDVVQYEGKLVRSTHQGLNSWAPGTLDYDGRIWEIIDEPETEPETGENTEQLTAPRIQTTLRRSRRLQARRPRHLQRCRLRVHNPKQRLQPGRLPTRLAQTLNPYS